MSIFDQIPKHSQAPKRTIDDLDDKSSQIKHRSGSRNEDGTSTLSNARDFSINNSTFVDKSTTHINNPQINNPQINNPQININNTNLNNTNPKRPGLRILLEKTIPGASHDSSDRYPPPRCHPGTRTGYIKMLIKWGRNVDSHRERIAWMSGPPAVGKSAIAQTCAEALNDKLAAAFFFSRPNHRDNPDYFFTSISYQLSVKYQSFGNFVDSEICRDPTLVKKSLPQQFHDLIVAPVHQLKLNGEEFPERVIIIDGLDECADAKAQEDIVKIIAESVQKRSTPFLWVFLSRLEPHLVGVFDTPKVKQVTLQIELHVSREIDGDIAMFLTDKLRETARKHPHLPSPWPSEEEVWVIVNLSDGRFACADAVVRFIDDDDMAGPEGQLHDILRLAREYSARKSRDRSLTGLDGFYTLIMERVPPKQLQTVLWILLATRMPHIHYAIENANLLGLSKSQFRNACRSLYSVMTLTELPRCNLYFYHASFMDFLEDPARSGRFCIWSDCAAALLDRLILKFDEIQVKRVEDKYVPWLPLTWEPYYTEGCYLDLLRAFFKLLMRVDLGSQGLKALNDFDLRKASLGDRWQALVRTIPQESELIRRATIKNILYSDQWGIWFKSLQRPVYVIGHGEKKALLVTNGKGDFDIQPYSKRSVQKLLEQMHKESSDS